MRVGRLALANFRNHVDTVLEPHERLTVIEGPNGHGKTNVLEAIDLLAGGRSFRRARPAHMVGPCASVAEVGATVASAAVDTTLRLTVSETGLRARRDDAAVRNVGELAQVCRTVVFSPADLRLVQDAPSERRDWLDAIAAGASNAFRQARADLTRVLTQRARLLTQMRERRGGTRGRASDPRECDAEAASTLAVWNEQLTAAGEHVAGERAKLCDALTAPANDYYRRISDETASVHLVYDATWMRHGLAAALAAASEADMRAGSNTVGPHRDDVALFIDDLPARTHRSQGEQRSLALALKLAQCAYLTRATGDPPIVLLDDVFSELDTGRAARLIDCLPNAQTVLTTATGTLPAGVVPDRHVHLLDGAISR